MGSNATPSAAATAPASARLGVESAEPAEAARLLADPQVLAVFGFGSGAPALADPRYLQVPLEPAGPAPLEVWRSAGPVRAGRDGPVQWSQDGALQFGAIEWHPAAGVDDDALVAGAAAVYARMLEWTRASGYPHLLRVWNYLDDILDGDGDHERYRRFCVGRAEGLGAFDDGTLPAATAIGSRNGSGGLQVYWLGAKVPGHPLENPRQVSAYRYPRQYGPQAPSFARALLPPPVIDAPLLLSGTASVVGHASLHPDSVADQLDETFRNLAALIAVAREARPGLPATLGAGSRLKVYVRDAADIPVVIERLDVLVDAAVPRIVLHATVCRAELRVEIDGVHGPTPEGAGAA